MSGSICRARAQVAALSLVLLAGCPAEEERRPTPEPTPAPETDPSVEAFLTGYFRSWSEGDMNGYSDCFHDDAVIVFVDGGEVRSRMPLEPFIEQQASMQQDPATRAVERMTGHRAHVDDVAATATVDWLLERGERRQRGVDRFSLIRDSEGRWKIVTLVFYVTDRGTGDP